MLSIIGAAEKKKSKNIKSKIHSEAANTAIKSHLRSRRRAFKVIDADLIGALRLSGLTAVFTALKTF